MAAYTLADARTFIRDSNLLATDERALRTELRVANHALALLRLGLGIHPSTDRKRVAVVFAAVLQGTTAPGFVSISGVTLTGTVGTNFGSEVVGRTIYIGNDLRPYLISAYAAPAGVRTLTLAETYAGPLDQDTQYSFVITDERQVLPLDFKSIDVADQGSILYRMEGFREVAMFDMARSRVSYLGSPPRFYAVEAGDVAQTIDDDTVAQRRSFLRIYPAPTAKTLIDVWYYGGAALFVSTADDDIQTFGLPELPESELVIEAYLLAAIRRAQGNMQEYQLHRNDADGLARIYAARLQPINASFERDRYMGGDEDGGVYRARFASGVLH